LAQTESVLRVRIGDLVVIEGRRVGQGRRVGKIVEVLGEPGHGHYRVRWEAGHETVLYPSNDATIQQADRRKKRKS
jgi:rRNA processing protein Gar1